MDIWELDKLVIFIAFVIPGFISIKCYQLMFPGTERPTSELLVDAVAYSSINYAILIAPIIWVESNWIAATEWWRYYLFYVFVFFVAPILWVVIWKWARTRSFLQRHAPHPIAKPWDYFFSQKQDYWVKVTLKDGSIIGGRFAENSFASSAPADEQIYIEETWILNPNGGFVRPKQNTAGVIILNSAISHIEFRR